jgi:hypothetical protein
MKRERVEDLGAIRVMMKGVLDDYDMFNRATSKHSMDGFIEYYGNLNHLEDLHDQIRWLNDTLHNILYLAEGDNDDSD